jgi:hypothetical protein
MFAALAKFKAQHNHCNVPAKIKGLGQWINRQRNLYRDGILREDRVKRLEDIGFVWNVIEANWEEMFAALAEFKKQHGHCNVPSGRPEYAGLSTWASHQRQLYKKGKLSEDRLERLEEIGFDWDIAAAYWEEMFGALVEFEKQHGHCNVPRDWSENSKLARWVTNLRTRKKRLSEDQILRLEAIGFEWDALDANWEEMFKVLVEFRDENGHCNVPHIWPSNRELGLWLGRQRQACKTGKLSEDRIKRLEAIGVVWDLADAAWEEMFAALVEYKNEYGDCDVPQSWEKVEGLGAWANRQRQLHKKGRLGEDRIERLEKIGFVWNLSEARWEKMFAALIDYRNEYGDCDVPQSWSKIEGLGQWVGIQRQSYRKGNLSEERIKRLEDIGFHWNKLEAYWEKMFAALVEYKNGHGDCLVSRSWNKVEGLGQWVDRQRHSYKKGKLSESRIERLEAIGFIWNFSDAHWEEMFAALVEYKNGHGNCDVPQRRANDEGLSKWVVSQRQAHKKGNLSENRIRRLEGIGFRWDLAEASWEEMFAALVEYKNEYGNCDVPQSWTKVKGLGTWANRQRQLHKKGRLGEDRVERLEKIGFVWNLSEARWEEMFAALVEYKNEHGNCDVPVNTKGLGGWVRWQRNARNNQKLSEDRVRRLNEIGFSWIRASEDDRRRPT